MLISAEVSKGYPCHHFVVGLAGPDADRGRRVFSQMVVTVPHVIASQRVGAKRRPMTGSAKQSREKQEDWIASSLALLAMTEEGERRHHFPAGDVSTVRPAGLSVRGRSAPSPRVPVAIRSDAASRIAAVSVAATSTTGVFIVTRSRC